MKPILSAVFLTLCCTAALFGQSDATGGYGGSFYQVPLGSRATALGGAYTSLANDGAGPLYNPAGISMLRKKLFSTSYRAMQLDRTHGYLTGFVPIRGEAVLGGTYVYSSSGSVEGRDSDGDVTGQDFSFTNHDIGIVFAKRFEDYLSMGVRMSYQYARFVEMSAASVNIDLGFMLYINELMGREKGALYPVQDIQVGLALRHLDSKYKWNNEKYLLKYVSAYEVGNDQIDNVPLEIGLGASGKFLEKRLLVALDATSVQHQSAQIAAGAEFQLSPQLALRAGFGKNSFAAGSGYSFVFGNRTLSIDYAFSAATVDEGSEHLFSIEVQF
jgi:hypothetical protein